jgi:hypothetical protein
MLFLKHVEFEIKDKIQLENLLSHIIKTTSQIEGVTYKDIYFVKGKKEFVLFLDCKNEQKYLEWRDICPPPPGAKDWYRVLLTRDECFEIQEQEGYRLFLGEKKRDSLRSTHIFTPFSLALYRKAKND